MRRVQILGLAGVMGLAVFGCEEDARPPAAPAPAPPRASESIEKPKLSAGEIASHVAASVVVIKTPDGFGAGFVAQRHHVVTCFHVVAGADRIVVRTSDGVDHPATAITAYDPRADVAVLDVPGLAAPSLHLGDSGDMEIGDGVTLIGHPEGLDETVSTGIISQLRELDGLRLFQITAPLSPGSSGGPMFNEFGEVVGIARATYTTGQALNFATPAKYIRSLLHASKAPMPLSQFATLTRPRPPEPAPDQAAPPGPTFPATVAGYSFGMTGQELVRLCPQGYVDVTMAECPRPPVEPFPIEKVLISLAYGRVTSVSLLLPSASLTDVARALVEKYGTPNVTLEWRDGKWRATKAWPTETRGAMQWDFDRGSFIRLGQAEDMRPFAAFVNAVKGEVEEDSY